MNIYTLQKLNKIIKSQRLKNAALWVLHVLNRRYLSVYFDPVLACNLRCKSCYFSNDFRFSRSNVNKEGLFIWSQMNL